MKRKERGGDCRRGGEGTRAQRNRQRQLNKNFKRKDTLIYIKACLPTSASWFKDNFMVFNGRRDPRGKVFKVKMLV